MKRIVRKNRVKKKEFVRAEKIREQVKLEFPPWPLRAMDVVNVRVLTQGQPRANKVGTVLEAGDRLVAIHVDLASLRCEVMASGCHLSMPTVVIAANNASTNLLKRESKLTEIGFPNFAHWMVFAVELHKSSLKVCLMRTPTTHPKPYSVTIQDFGPQCTKGFDTYDEAVAIRARLCNIGLNATMP